jgi:predicted nucleic acid-binding protein
MILVDSNIILDVWNSDPIWATWSQSQLSNLATAEELGINAIVYAEVSPRYHTQANLELKLNELELHVLMLPNEAAFLAGKAFELYRKQGGTKTNVLPDFFIGAHAMVLNCPLLTRDTKRYATYFPSVHLITP